MPIAVDRTEPAVDAAAPSRPRGREPLLVIAVVALVASPLVVAALAFVGVTWYPVGDLSGLWFRIGQVGTSDTPLVGAETIKGFAHPGPLEFYLAAPLYRLTDGDPRSLFWTAAAVNVAAVAGIGWVSWRRGRWPLLLGSLTMVAVLLHTLGPSRLTSIWNPFLPLFPFLCLVFLVWDVALGHRRSILPAALAASLAAQTHLAFATLVGLVGAWFLLWLWLRPRLLPTAGDGERPAELGDLAAQPLRSWWRPLAPGLLVAAVLALPMAIDALFDSQNPRHILQSVRNAPEQVGLADGIGIVGRYVRPDGPWIGGSEPTELFSVQGSGPLPVLLALVVLGSCALVARRRRFADVTVLSTLALALVVGAIPATSQIYLPAYDYLTQFLKIVGALVWFTAAWTLWRLAEPWVRARRARSLTASVLGFGLVVAATAWTWGPAASLDTPNPEEEEVVQVLRGELGEVLSRGDRLRVEYRGDPLNIPGPGVIRWLIHDGFDVVTADGSHGLKWGHEHRYEEGDEVDAVLTVAVHYDTGFTDAYAACAGDGGVELIARYDELTGAERQYLEETRLAALGDRSAIPAERLERADEIARKGFRIGVFRGDHVCGDDL